MSSSRMKYNISEPCNSASAFPLVSSEYNSFASHLSMLTTHGAYPRFLFAICFEAYISLFGFLLRPGALLCLIEPLSILFGLIFIIITCIYTLPDLLPDIAPCNCRSGPANLRRLSPSTYLMTLPYELHFYIVRCELIYTFVGCLTSTTPTVFDTYAEAVINGDSKTARQCMGRLLQ
ncbi:hypothetical protein BDQ12DRAFT_337028 [Crucibulum laeve]|uniref:Uncharacterized protein n=1 Tax=Crucibulum laeve TaxID=68775 RepID=A0A5C3M181_9AGAR|nr:hypothetical protein BDQ12DRAFT_337028 [Crucibulum laeve]